MSIGEASAARIVLAIALCVQLWNVASQLPVTEVFSGEPFYVDDYILHFARAETVAAQLAETGRLWTYDPGHMAGHPLGVSIIDLDNQGMAVLFALLPFVDPAVVFNAVAWLCFALAPLGIAWATCALGFALTEAAAAAAAAVFVSNVTYYVDYGMFAGFAAAYVSVGVVALVHRAFDSPSPARFAQLAVVGAAGVFFHVLVGLLVLLPTVLLVMLHARDRPVATLLRAGAVAAVIVLLNLAWLVPFLRFAGDIGFDYPNPFFYTGPLWWIYENYVRAFAGWHVFLLALAVGGFVGWARGASAPLRIAWAVWVLLLVLICTQGSSIPLLSHLEPARFVLPLEFALCPFAGCAAARIARGVAGRLALASGWVPALALLVFAPYLAWSVVFVGQREPLSTRIPEATRELERWIERHTHPSARVMIEDRRHVERPRLDPDVPLHPYADGHFLAALPRRIHRELIGGPYAEAPTAPHRADFASARAFGRRIERWRPADLARVLETYNVGWIVAWSTPSRRYLEANPGIVTRVDRLGVFTLFRTHHRHSFFAQGDGNLEAGLGEIRVWDATPGGVVLRYHGYTGMCTDPALPVTTSRVPGAVFPFLEVRNGNVRSFTLRPARSWSGGC